MISWLAAGWSGSLMMAASGNVGAIGTVGASGIAGKAPSAAARKPAVNTKPSAAPNRTARAFLGNRRVVIRQLRRFIPPNVSSSCASRHPVPIFYRTFFCRISSQRIVVPYP